jgi:DNA repair ATPase RecN
MAKDTSGDNYTNVLLEEMREHFDAVTELVSGMAEDVTTLKEGVHSIDKRLGHVESDVAVLKVAITDISREQVDHGGRLVRIDQRLDGIDHRLDGVDQRLDRVGVHTQLLPAIQAAIKEHSTDVADHSKRLAALERVA